MKTQTHNSPGAVPLAHRSSLLSIARRVFWWGKPEEWLEDSVRFAAQVMTYGEWEDVRTTLDLLGKNAFLEVLKNPPPGVFDQKSWTFWHVYYHQAVPPMPVRSATLNRRQQREPRGRRAWGDRHTWLNKCNKCNNCHNHHNDSGFQRYQVSQQVSQ